MEQELGYICPQTKKQCDDECCVSAEDCHAEAINNIISNCEPEQLNQNKMEKEFVPYDLAAKLKELGFDEPCFGFYYIKEINLFESCKINERRNSSYIKDYMSEEDCSAPTFSQAFRWFRDKYKLISHINWVYKKMDGIDWYYNVKGIDMINNNVIPHTEIRLDTYEEAELDCLTKLIEIVELKSE